MGYVFDTDDLRLLVADLGKAEAAAIAEARKVVEKGAVNIKKDWQRRWSGLAHAPALPAAITYDAGYGFGKIEAEIGPDKGRRQGALGNLIEFGSVNNAPIPGGVPALQAEAPRFEKALIDALGDPL
jgi:hypothetical protein